jgi:hypothetical protein
MSPIYKTISESSDYQFGNIHKGVTLNPYKNTSISKSTPLKHVQRLQPTQTSQWNRFHQYLSWRPNMILGYNQATRSIMMKQPLPVDKEQRRPS